MEKLKASEVLRAMQAGMEAEIQRKAAAKHYADRQGVVSQAMASRCATLHPPNPPLPVWRMTKQWRRLLLPRGNNRRKLLQR